MDTNGLPVLVVCYYVIYLTASPSLCVSSLLQSSCQLYRLCDVQP